MPVRAPWLAAAVFAMLTGGCATAPPEACRALAKPAAAEADIDRLRCRAALGLQSAEVELARRYEIGDGVPQDLARAAAMYERAAADVASTMPIYSPPVRRGGSGSVIMVRNPNAQTGSPEARFRLGLMLLEGRGVDADPRRGRRLIERAARAGHAEAVKWLAAQPEEGRQPAR